MSDHAVPIRVILPAPLSVLAGIPRELSLANVVRPVTQRAIIDAIEAGYPRLVGTLRDHGADRRRPLVRFFACEQDLSHEPPDAPVPAAVANGHEPFIVVGAIAGG